MQFNNHPPINFDGCEKLAKASRDGGAYDGIGWHTFSVFKSPTSGKIHVAESSNSGCDYGSGTATYRTYHGKFDNVEALCEWLTKQEDENHGSCSVPWWANELMEALGYQGEPA